MNATDTTQEPVVGLICCCCGSCTQGRQWWNRDEGYGFCSDCASRFTNVEHGQEDRSYGVRGYHFDLQVLGRES